MSRSDVKVIGQRSEIWSQKKSRWFILVEILEESIRMTEDRDKWRKYVHGVANPRIEDG